MKQFSLYPVPSPAHGGELSTNRRKTLRPLARKRPIHLILKAKRAFRQDGPAVLKEAQRQGEKLGLKIYDRALAKDHLHLVLSVPGRREYNAFIRALTGLLARKLGKGIWALSPFTRVGFWGQPYRVLQKYLEQNRLEASGEIPYQRRTDWYKRRKRKR